jgi:hypothetical protein
MSRQRGRRRQRQRSGRSFLSLLDAPSSCMNGDKARHLHRDHCSEASDFGWTISEVPCEKESK